MRGSEPVISVIMPVYNCAGYIKAALESILNQTETDLECIVIDDVSADGTVEIAKSFKDNRLIVIEKETHSGYTNSLNLGISQACGKYIARMDGDDFSDRHRLERQRIFLDENPDTGICGTWYHIPETGKTVKTPMSHRAICTTLIWHNCLAHPSVMMRKSLLTKVSYNPAYEPAEDYLLWIQLAGITKLANIPEVLLNYRMHDDSVSSKNKLKQEENAAQIRSYTSGWLIWPDAETETVFYRLRRIELKNANAYNQIWNRMYALWQTNLKNALLDKTIWTAYMQRDLQYIVQKWLGKKENMHWYVRIKEARKIWLSGRRFAIRHAFGLLPITAIQ
ncbi:MAG: glycosyltransferase [Bacteroidetes bacterium]|nr:glycosyltransferase [Bacteroidota bacterium]